MQALSVKGKKLRLVIDQEAIKKRVEELAQEIDRDMGEPFIAVGLLKGSFIFLADLIRSVSLPVKVDFMWVSSYGSGTVSEGHVRVLKDISMNIQGEKVLLVDDILDTGYTLKEIIQILKMREPKILKTCVLLDKYERRKVEVKVDYTGFYVPDAFLVGYGLDWDEEGRNLRGIYAVEGL
ncbi:MAG: hypoxanthine phosphoribosyltransferase [Hydrogenobacter sp.]|uniref:hypoxanthine phosphoribosyltransferase n=1 Tax=Hydrogenobacter thermophilus TaxID=940 RepID=UPI0030F9C89B